MIRPWIDYGRTEYMARTNKIVGFPISSYPLKRGEPWGNKLGLVRRKS